MVDDPALTVPLSEQELLSFERLARGDAAESIVLALIADIRRLRRLVNGAALLLTPNSGVDSGRARAIYASIKAEGERR